MSTRQQIVITPNKTLGDSGRELWEYRDLFYFLAWRDFKVRYKQTAIGAAWAVIRPLLTMLVFTVIFGRIAKLPTEGEAPYAIMVFTAMLPWNFFSNTLSESANAVVNNSAMISKVYFPRIIVPTAPLLVNIVDFLISFVLLLALMAWYRFQPSIYILLMPLFLLLAAITALGLGYLISALNVKYRDFRYVIPFIVQIGLYISPVGFSSQVVPEQWRLWYSLNPMVGVIDGFRWIVIGDNSNIYWDGFLLSNAISLTLFLIGYRYFMHTERQFADSL
ncbi:MULTISPECIES: ABC transporter permease [Methylomonas]|uniref:Transport permease protein n=2 Tax=Methylomonas TaxID=416 RepID=A0A140E5M8_9GAMM|nr:MULTISPECIES: ABC transporter permease [Methylomonas]AMK78702.1 phosphate ABC transporter permease [Methylomonas denitrificans]OAI03698.1 phosphate ABC transporter permease [Methylomonas methanica]TCV83545.1 lipopolysaccharide transport system permease protein [Methylomonas methanica]